MPFYISNYELSFYKNKKKLFMLNELNNSGLLNHLDALPKAKAVILFGSMSRSDWYKDSDIDVFIYGNPEGLKVSEFERKLGREIQLFICEDKDNLMKLGNGLLKNIIRGNVIKGTIDFVDVKISLNSCL